MRCSNCNRSKGAMEHEGVEGIEETCLCGVPWGEETEKPRNLQRVRAKSVNTPIPFPCEVCGAEIFPPAGATFSTCSCGTCYRYVADEVERLIGPLDVLSVRPRHEEPRTVHIGPDSNAVMVGCNDSTMITLGARELFAAVYMHTLAVCECGHPEERDIKPAFDFAEKCVEEGRRKRG